MQLMYARRTSKAPDLGSGNQIRGCRLGSTSYGRRPPSINEGNDTFVAVDAGGGYQKPLIWQPGTRPGARLMLVRRFRRRGGAPRMLNIALGVWKVPAGRQKMGMRRRTAKSPNLRVIIRSGANVLARRGEKPGRIPASHPPAWAARPVPAPLKAKSGAPWQG